MPSSQSTAPPAISDALSKQLEAYKGRWVAVLNNAIVGDGDSAKEAVAKALQKNATDPVVFRVRNSLRRVKRF